MKSLFTIFLVFAISANIACAQQASKPNIIYILVDDMGYGDVNFNLPGREEFKNPFIKTPNLEQLAKQSLVMTHHYAAATVCSPSRAGLLTGRTPTRTNINHWIPDREYDSEHYLHNEEITIAELLKEAGYETAIFGKWHLNAADWQKKENWHPEFEQGSFPNQQGFDHGMVSKENPHLSLRMNSNSQKNPGDYFNLKGEHLGTQKGYSSAILTDSTLNWIKGRQSENPYFIYLPYDAPHECIYNPDYYDALYDTGNPNKDMYYANVTYLDHQIGRLFRGLEELGQLENTIIFFSSDNGPEIAEGYWGALRCWGTSYPLYGHKNSLYEGGIRVPAFVTWHNKIQPGITEVPVSTLDILPTLCELANIKVPNDRDLDGANILPLLLGESDKVERKQPLYWQCETPMKFEVVGTGYDTRWHGKGRILEDKMPTVAVRSGNYVLRGMFIEKFKEPKEFVLYDVVNDPMENNELSAQQPALFNSLKKELLDIYKRANRERTEGLVKY